MDKVGGEEEEGPMYGESNIEIYNTIYMGREVGGGFMFGNACKN